MRFSDFQPAVFTINIIKYSMGGECRLFPRTIVAKGEKCGFAGLGGRVFTGSFA
jgi:hypothetical protein